MEKQEIYIIFQRRTKTFKPDEWEKWEFHSVADTDEIAELTIRLNRIKYPKSEFNAVKVEPGS